MGFYDGDFIGFRTPASSEVDTALREAVVAVDANVLLNLYRFRAQTSQDLIKILERLGDRLVVPHQALREFWRHRQRSAASPQSATSTAEEAIVKSTAGLTQSIEGWAKHVGVDAGELATLTSRISDFAQTMKSALATTLDEEGGRNSAGDSILEDLERLLDGRVTEPLSEDIWNECVAEAQRRIQAEEPPGYRDAAKEDGDIAEGGAGDYLVWYQATRHAASVPSDLVIVTSDEKDDWWWRQRATFVGPRPELTLEYHELCGKRLFLLRPSDLLARAAALEVEVDEASAADADRVRDDTGPAVPWTRDALLALLDRLDIEAPVQSAALRIAITSGVGTVSREKVYELGDYSDDRMLRGFTRPFRRLTETLQEEGRVPRGVPSILVARYPDGVKASFFAVPPEVAGMDIKTLDAVLEEDRHSSDLASRPIAARETSWMVNAASDG
jgi:PIN like domain